MREITISLFLASTLLLSGCGDSSSRDNKTPTDTLKLLRGVSQDGDWTWYVKTAAKESDGILKFKTDFDLAIPDDVKHIQYFIDTDNNANTGFTTGQDSWRIAGADILIEDGNVYKSLSNGGEWKWKYITHVDNYSRSKYEILFNINKNILNSNSDRVNVTMEAFDANWNGSYDTISTQVVKFASNSSNQKTPKEIINDRLNDQMTYVEEFVYTPQHQGAVVLEKSQEGQHLALYGLENSNNPVREYQIDYADDRVKFSDIKMLGNGKIQYMVTYFESPKNTTHTLIVYDYFHKKQISKTKIGGNTENNKTPKEILIEKIHNEGSIVSGFYYTPKHQGAIVLTNAQTGHFPSLELYGLEDPQNPVFEYEIDLGDDAVHFKNIEVLPNGKLKYLKRDGHIQYEIVYDYFHKKQISKTKISNSITMNPDTINSTDQFKDEQNIVLDIIKDNIIKKGWKPPRIEIEGIRKIDNTHYIVRYILYYFDFRAKIEIFDIENKKPTVTLESWKEGPGGTQLKDGDFIQIDLVKKTVSYKQTNSFDDLLSEYVKNYLTGETISLKETHMGY